MSLPISLVNPHWSLLLVHFQLGEFHLCSYIVYHMQLAPSAWSLVTSCNIIKQLLTSSSPFRISVTTLVTSTQLLRFPEPSFHAWTLVVINFQSWTLSIVKSHLLFLSDPASLCSFIITLPCCVLLHTSVTPTLAPYCTSKNPWLMLWMLTQYMRLLILYDNVHVWISTLILLSLSTQPHLDSQPLTLSFQTSRNNPLSLPEL